MGEGLVAACSPYLRGVDISILSILCDTPIYHRIRHYCHFRDKHHVLDTLRKTLLKRDIRRHGRSTIATPPPAFTPPARLSPLRHASCTSQPYILAIATSVPIHRLDPLYRCILKQTPTTKIP